MIPHWCFICLITNEVEYFSIYWPFLLLWVVGQGTPNCWGVMAVTGMYLHTDSPRIFFPDLHIYLTLNLCVSPFFCTFLVSGI